MYQDPQLQSKLDHSSIVGQSVIHNGGKIVLLEEKRLESESIIYNMIRFNQKGEAHEIGSFRDYKEQMNEKLIDFDQYQPKSNIKFAKEYFVTSDGQVIKFAAIISHEKDLEAEDQNDLEDEKQDEENFKEKKNIKEIIQKKTRITVFKIYKNN